MYEMFQRVPNQPGGLVFPEFRRVRDGLRRSIDRVKLFRWENPMSLTGTHPLIRLMMSLNVPLSMDPDMYVERVRSITYSLARNLQFTSPVSQGRLHYPSMFYGDNVSDIVLVHDEAFDLTDIATRWKDLQPIRVLYHPQTDLRLHVPDGKAPSAEAGFAVVSINLPMLALQYKLWRNWERGTVGAESPRTLMMFLQAIPLPQMLYSHLDCAIFNRVVAQYFELPMPEIRSRHSYFLTDWTREVDAVLFKYIGLARARQMDFDAMIETMPTAGYDSRYETLRWPEMPFTYQVTWAMVIARLATLMFLVRFGADQEITRNRSQLAELNRFFIKLYQMNLMQKVLPKDELQTVDLIIQDGIVPYLTTS